MDVEKIQKVNNLALDLVKQGLAADREEAIAQAEKIFQNQDTKEYDELKETLEGVNEDKKPVEEKKEVTESGLSQDEIKEILQKNTTFIVQKFKEYNEKIASLERDLGEIRTKMTYNKLPIAQEVKKKEEITVNEATEVPAPQPKTQEEKKEAAPNHPRSGNYSDSDVSIEKFFYMGK